MIGKQVKKDGVNVKTLLMEFSALSSEVSVYGALSSSYIHVVAWPSGTRRWSNVVGAWVRFPDGAGCFVHKFAQRSRTNMRLYTVENANRS